MILAGRTDKQDQDRELFLLSTCLRVELVFPGRPEVTDVLTALYGSGFPAPVIRYDLDAFAHLARVAAGLESPVVGEPEVLGQFRQAMATYRISSSNQLARVLDAVVSVGRDLRRDLGQVSSGSLATIAAGLARSRGRVAVLGSGTMARAAVEHLNGAEVTVFARRPVAVSGIEAVPWERIEEAFTSHDAVISTIPGKPDHPRVGRVEQAISTRNRPMLMIDLGMPPGLDHLHDPLVTYIGIDDLARESPDRVPASIEERAQSEISRQWRRLVAPDRAGEVIAAVGRKAEQAIEDEVKRVLARVVAAADPEPMLRQLARRVSRRVLHAPVAFIGTANSGEIELLAQAFGVDDE